MDEKIEQLFAFYALGSLTATERSQVEAYIASNPDAKERLEEMIRTASALAYGAAPLEPSPVVKDQLMARIREDARTRFAPAAQTRSRQVPARAYGGRLAYAVAVLSLLIAAGVGIWGLNVRKEVARLQTEVAVLEQEVQSQRTVLAQLTSPQAHAYAIAGTDFQPQAQGQLIADPNTGSGVLVISGLKPLPAGNTYEFWLIKDKTAVPAGLFKANEGGVTVLQVTQNLNANPFNAIGVSVEPAGGSQQPTGDIVMLGKVQ